MIYLDYAATSFIKPKSVYKAVYDTMLYHGANAGRGGHRLSVTAGEIIYSVREKLCELFHAAQPESFAFFPNTTMALNAAIKGILKNGDHVLVSSMEHNSVMRPLYSLAKNKQVRFSVVKADALGRITPNDFLKELRPSTKLVICTHASNVCGNFYNVCEIAKMAHHHNALCLIDAAQSAGVLEINAKEFDFIAFPGHKSLYGPQGSGGLYVRDGLYLDTLTEGGTGSQSELFEQPKEMPDRLESGTQNVAAIAGLGAGIDFILSEGRETIFEYEKSLTDYFIQKLQNLPDCSVYGDEHRVGVVSLNLENIDCIEVSERLDKEYDIAVRSGLHCAVSAHESLGTKETGTVRFSFGYFTKKQEIDKAVDALYKIAKESHKKK